MLKYASFLVFLFGMVAASLVANDGAISSDQNTSLRLVPANAIAVLHCKKPGRLVQQLQSYVSQLELLNFDEVKELLQSTPYQRFYRFLGYLEKVYGRPWDKLLDDLTGNGVSLALIPGKDAKQPQVLGIVQAKDAKLLAQAFAASLDVLKQEATNIDESTKVASKAYRNIMVTALGDTFFLAQHDQTLLLATKEHAMSAAIDQLLDAKKTSILQHPRFVKEEKPNSEDALLWGWLDITYLKNQGKDEIEKIKLPTNDLLPQLLFGGLFDTVVRSDHAWMALRHGERGPKFEITTPTGRSASQEGARRLHMHDPEKAPILPLLHPPGTLYSTSFYWDLSALWEYRTKIYKEGALKDFEESDKSVKPFLAGNTLGNLFSTLGARHRIIVARQRTTGYSMKPKTPYPAFALVAECNDPDKFNRLVAIPLRTAGFLFSTQVSMKLFEESHGNSKMVGYRFNEVDKNRGYDQGTLFNYSPTFTRVGNYFIVSSTRELCVDLIDEMNKPQSSHPAVANADMHHQFSWAALGDALATERPRIATELTLRHGGASDRVDEQISAVLKLLDKLGTLDVTISHSPSFRLEIQTNYK